MRTLPTTGKPYTVPADDAPAETLISVYWWDVSQHPLLLANLRRPDGSLYLDRKVSSRPIDISNLSMKNDRTA